MSTEDTLPALFSAQALRERHAAIETTPANDNTEAGFQQAVSHYVYTFRRTLPATPNDIIDYILTYADPILNQGTPQHSQRTVATRLAHLAKWHNLNGFADPTKHPSVKDTFKKVVRPEAPRKAESLSYAHILTINAHLLSALDDDSLFPAQRGQCLRDRALLMLGFWRGFRVSELALLTFSALQHKTEPARNGTPARDYLQVFLTDTKGDRAKHGVEYRLWALPSDLTLCPLEALRAWQCYVEDRLAEKNGGLYGPATGPVFRRIFKNGAIQPEASAKALSRQAVNTTIKAVAALAGIEGVEFSTHSMRRGCLNELVGADVPLVKVSSYVKHKNPKTTAAYVDEFDGREAQDVLARGLLSEKQRRQAEHRLSNERVHALTVTIESASGERIAVPLKVLGASEHAIATQLEEHLHRMAGVIDASVDAPRKT